MKTTQEWRDILAKSEPISNDDFISAIQADARQELDQRIAQLEQSLSKAANAASWVHPAAIVENGIEVKRSEYKDGWNAAMAEITKIIGGLDDDRWIARECYDRVDKEACEARKRIAQLEQRERGLVEALQRIADAGRAQDAITLAEWATQALTPAQKEGK